MRCVCFLDLFCLLGKKVLATHSHHRVNNCTFNLALKRKLHWYFTLASRNIWDTSILRQVFISKGVYEPRGKYFLHAGPLLDCLRESLVRLDLCWSRTLNVALNHLSYWAPPLEHSYRFRQFQMGRRRNGNRHRLRLANRPCKRYLQYPFLWLLPRKHLSGCWGFSMYVPPNSSQSPFVGCEDLV